MTVNELIEELQYLSKHHGNAEVGFAYEFGDYWNSTAVGDINNVDTAFVGFKDSIGENIIRDQDADGVKEQVIISPYSML